MYDGGLKEPGVTVKDGETTLTEGTDYTLSYKNNKGPGMAAAVISGIGGYTSSVEKSFIICFTDVPMTHSYRKAVYWAVEEGIAAGYTGKRLGLFGIGDDITRGQVVMFLWRAAGKPEPEHNTQTFSDVPVKHNFYKAVQWAAENGITAGYSDGTFGVGKTCTRGHCVTFLYRMDQKGFLK